jgi:ABC-type methionine transport system ATPase subunit
MTLILVTHEMRFARDVGTKLVFMHQGKVHEEGVPKDVFAAPRTQNCGSSSAPLVELEFAQGHAMGRTATSCDCLRFMLRSEY